MLRPSDILNELEYTMRNYKPHRKTQLPATAYQWLNRLPEHMRKQLIDERGMPGRGSVASYLAASVVSDALEIMAREGKVEISYTDSEGEATNIEGQWIELGYTGGCVARYRLL